MCGKLGTSEVDTIKNMMTMTVYFVLADIFDLDVMDMFNGCELDFSTMHKVQDVIEQIVTVEPIHSSVH